VTIRSTTAAIASAVTAVAPQSTITSLIARESTVANGQIAFNGQAATATAIQPDTSCAAIPSDAGQDAALSPLSTAPPWSAIPAAVEGERTVVYGLLTARRSIQATAASTIPSEATETPVTTIVDADAVAARSPIPSCTAITCLVAIHSRRLQRDAAP
jgi:hypothetical protein